jgi:hypothetical protein
MTSVPWSIAAMIGALFVGGAVCTSVAIRSWWRTRRRARSGCVVEATVVELVPMDSAPDEQSFLTVFEFSDRRGTRHRVRSKWASSPAPHAVGARIRVSYDPDAPDDADIVQQGQSLVALGALGAALSLIAVLLWWGLAIGAFTVS